MDDATDILAHDPEKNLLVNLIVTLIALVFIGLFGLGVVAYRDQIALDRVNSLLVAATGNCDFQRARTANAEIFFSNRATLENRAAHRGYKTSPDWSGLATNDRDFVVAIQGSFVPGCGPAPLAPPQDDVVRPFVTMRPPVTATP